MPLEAVGDDARRPVDVARETGSTAGDLPLEFSNDEELGTRSGLAGDEEWR